MINGDKLKIKILFFAIIFFISSCSSKHNENKKLNIMVAESIKNGNLNQLSLAGTEKIYSIGRFSDTESSVNNMEIALNKGYRTIINDIYNGKLKCINIKNIDKKYIFSDWETRNIGFSNWPTYVKGEILLSKIKILNLNILIMKLLNDKEFTPLVEQNLIDLRKSIDELSKMANENNWVD